MTAVIANIRFRAQASLGCITDGITRTVLVGGATDNRHTPYTGIWICNCVLGATTGVSTTWYIYALSTSSTFAGSCPALIHIHALRVRISRETRRAGTRKSSSAVRACGILTTTSERSVQQIALVDVHTTRRDIAGVVGPSILAHTVGFVLIRLAIGVSSTPHILAWLFASHPWGAAHISRLAFTAVRSRCVQALGMGTTDLCMGATLIDVHTA